MTMLGIRKTLFYECLNKANKALHDDVLFRIEVLLKAKTQKAAPAVPDHATVEMKLKPRQPIKLAGGDLNVMVSRREKVFLVEVRPTPKRK